MIDDRRYCPLHGDYLPRGRSAQCPDCRDDPAASSVSLRQVRVLDEEQLDPEGHDEPNLTPLGEFFTCPVCGSEAPGVDFRVEAAGEVWLGDAAVWAEEGVCGDCYREVVRGNIRQWTQAEWLVHHYEGWRRMTESAHDILVYEYSPHESWLPEEERHPILDLEGTLATRREHLARCQMAMEELQGRYDVKTTPPPFQMTLASASEALSEAVIEELQAQRDADLSVESELRLASVHGTPSPARFGHSEDDIPTVPETGALIEDHETVPMIRRREKSSVLLGLLIAAAVIAVVLLVVALRT